jgi:hypothetical protein
MPSVMREYVLRLIHGDLRTGIPTSNWKKEHSETYTKDLTSILKKGGIMRIKSLFRSAIVFILFSHVPEVALAHEGNQPEKLAPNHRSIGVSCHLFCGLLDFCSTVESIY